MNIPGRIEEFLKSDKVRALAEKIRRDKKNLLIILLCFVGIFMIAVSEADADDIKEEADTDAQYGELDFKNAEKKLKELIECINGAGDVKVYITYESHYETVYAADSDVKTEKDQVHSKKEYILTDEDTGLVLKKIYPRVRGVAVICQGGNDPVIKEKIYSVVSALFDISTNKISVADME